MRLGGILFGLVSVFWSFGAAAQDRWVQIEALPTLGQAEQRARAYSNLFRNVEGYAMTTGWFAIAIGPFDPTEADRQLFQLKGERLIPADSYIAYGDKFTERFWPAGLPSATPTDTANATQPSDGTEVAPTATLDLPAETPAEARRSEALLTAEERMELQRALQWEEHYAGAIDGAIGAGTRRSMAEWQRHQGFDETGILTTAQRAQLVSAYNNERAALGLETLTETEAGIEITLPGALVVFDRYEPPFVHFSARDGSGMRVVLISQQGDQTTLAGLYTAMQSLEAVPIEGERQLRATDFTLTGQNANLRSYTQAGLKGGLIKGFSLIWEPKADAQADKVLAAMKSGFQPIGDKALNPSLGEPLAVNRTDLMSGLEIRKPKLSRSGFYAGPDGIVATTTEVLDSCARLTLDGTIPAEIAYRDDAAGVAILRPDNTLAPRAKARLATAPMRVNSEIALAGFSYGEALDAAAISFGTLADSRGLNGEANQLRLTVAALPGDAGGPVLDSTGHVAGMLLPRDAAGSGRVLPDDVALALNAETIAAALAGIDGITATEETEPASGTDPFLAPEDLTHLGRDLTVLVSCWK